MLDEVIIFQSLNETIYCLLQAFLLDTLSRDHVVNRKYEFNLKIQRVRDLHI